MTVKKKITVVGVGALGSHLVLLLRNMDVSIKIVDFDRVEQRNVASQFHSKPSIGKSKVQSLQQSMSFLFGSKLEMVPHKLVPDNIDKVLSGSELVVDCLDNSESRRLVRDYIRRTLTPCLHGALSGDGSFGVVAWDETFTIDQETTVGAPTCEDGAFLPFIVLVSSYMARAIQDYLTDGVMSGYTVHPGGSTKI